MKPDAPHEVASTRKKTASSRSIRINKQGQTLGRKGNETRYRLMEAARRLLKMQSPVELTAVSIAKEAGTSSATFYIYFDDVRDIIYALSEVASLELGEVHRLLEQESNPAAVDMEHARRVVDAFNDVWNRHRDVLRYRNLEADRGDRAFSDLRVRSAIRIIDRFVERIMAAYPEKERPSRGQAYAEATVLFAAMEGIAETDPALVKEWQIGAARLSVATAWLLARSFGARNPAADAIDTETDAAGRLTKKAAKRTTPKQTAAAKTSRART
ncbi:TetR/AcrR family transcriptional regulator [Paraburkholderia phymatum]|uniref:TetR/AcrR family transcriptional regulator n=1 Tax=Paraburkholderia phymatum TaxID=148447 RepID=UPI0031729FD2